MADDTQADPRVVNTRYPKAKMALRFAVVGVALCVLHLPATTAAALLSVEFVRRVVEVGILGLALVALGLCIASIVKTEEKTWLACVVAVLGFAEVIYGAKMLMQEFHRVAL